MQNIGTKTSNERQYIGHCNVKTSFKDHFIASHYAYSDYCRENMVFLAAQPQLKNWGPNKVSAGAHAYNGGFKGQPLARGSRAKPPRADKSLQICRYLNEKKKLEFT